MPEISAAPRGLSTAEVEQRRREGRTNDVPDAPVRTVGQIVRNNVLTPVNAIIGSMFVLIMVAGFPADALFAGVVVSNSAIGIAQELKARRELHRLAVMSAPRARVVRDGRTLEVGTSEVVADEILELQPGDQVVVDGEVVAARGLEIDESLLTGERDPVDKSSGDGVMSGSFVNAGAGWYRATAIGADSYAARLAEEARRFKLAGSELTGGVNVILRRLTWIIPLATVLLLGRLLATEDRWQEALRGTVAAAVAMVPDGLVLLTSLSFFTGVVALARRRALAKELASVELLARVDTLCLDKTGTITTGDISFERVEPLGSTTETEATGALAALASADPAPNATLAAIIDAVGSPPPGWQLTGSVPFSSARKWAAASFEGRGTFHLGAPDVLLGAGDASDEARTRAAAASVDGERVLVVTRAGAAEPSDEALPADREPLCLVRLGDTLRSDAAEIFAYFRDQGVDLKVISGDHPATVAAVAHRAGITGDLDGGAAVPGRPHPPAVDARRLPAEPGELADTLESTTVFGRVDPHQKRAMVHALQSRGRTVAMTGDGVNDVLALKDADMGIAMGTGSSAARAVAQLVLLDNRFATLPRVLAEGRRVINNIERVANLFITKAAYAVLLTLLIGLAGSPFPFLPRHLTLIGTFSVGVPGFFLALAPNHRLVKPGFLRRVLRFSLPAGAVAGVVTFVLYEVVRRLDGVSLDEARTSATMTLLGVGLVILVLISRPLRPWKVGLAAAMAASYGAAMALPFLREFFELDAPSRGGWLCVLVAVVVGGAGAWGAVELRESIAAGREAPA
ncbi:MAG: HAD-IC family P-type ATPase [Acidimicrobiaceae bacterium]|nr:HAD-IC family P-type ATPase [Acidimicrobiaceae bacterium]MYH42441.1 HAD-IC family P-type ATPase [Acidimicrobiaceae bacterium]MYI55338.1 HAD-IC family P-type ATPase [Acidimicrobiaceae bacterium]MYJ41330.1 HAD-IC family P-type ATPase [Acidimicrobiaceae bacterium]